MEETKSKAKRERETPAGHPALGHPEKTKNHGIWRQDKIEKPDKNVSAGKDAFQTNAEPKGNVRQRSHVLGHWMQLPWTMKDRTDTNSSNNKSSEYFYICGCGGSG